jgi:cobalt/nickel transport system permease protein
MHLPDGVLSLPVVAATTVVGGSAIAYGLARLKDRSADRTVVLMGMMAAFVFAAQMVNFPVFPGVSGHLMGGVLASVVLGPWAGACVIASVLVVQALLFADGGLTALGANFINMGLVGAVVGHALFAEFRRLLGGGVRGTIMGAMVAAWLAVLISAGLCALELAWSNPAVHWMPLLGWMMLIHAAIGLVEAVITGVILRSILAVRSDLIPGAVESRPEPAQVSRFALAGLGVAVAVALFLAPFAYDAPDGLETVRERLGLPEAGVAAEATPKAPMSDARPQRTAPMAEYTLPLPGITSIRAATAAAGVVGTLVVCALAALLARAVARPSSAIHVLVPPVLVEAGSDAA